MAGSSGTSQFRVRIFGIAGAGLQLPSGDAAIKLLVNFDGFKEFETEERALDANPAWAEDISFTYSTKHANQLSRKKLRLTVLTVSSGFFGTSTKEWGVATVDLHTLATGPVTHRNIRVLDGSSPRGGLSFNLEMEQIITATVNLDAVTVAGNPNSAAGTAALQFSYTGHDQYTSNAVCSPAGGPYFSHLPQLRLETVFHTFATSGIAFWLRSHNGSTLGPTLASGTFPTNNTPIFTEGKPVEMNVGLTGIDGRPAGRLSGRLWYTSCPSFLQMRGGYHTDSGIYGATYVVPALPNKPKVYVQPAAGAGGPSTRLGRLGTAVLAGQPHGHRHHGHVQGADGSTAQRGGAVHPRAAFPAPAPASVSAGGLTSGQLGAQIAVRALGAAKRGGGAAAGSTVVLPRFWERRIDTRHGRAYFFNTITSTSVWELPSAPTVEVTFSSPGPLGLELEHNFSGTRRFGFPSGRRGSGSDSGAVVKTVVPGAAAARAAPALAPGMHLTRVNGVATVSWTLAQVLRILRNSARPLSLVFRNPYAVPAHVAAAAQDTSLVVEAGDKAMLRVPPGRGGGSAAPPAPVPTPGTPGYTYGREGGASEGAGPAAAAAGDGGESGGEDSDGAYGLDASTSWVQMKDHMSGKVFWLNNATGAVSFTQPTAAQ